MIKMKELFDKPVKYKETNIPGVFEFTVEGIKYTCVVRNESPHISRIAIFNVLDDYFSYNDLYPQEFSPEVYREFMDSVEKMLNRSSTYSIHFQDEEGRTTITGTGNQFTVFSTVGNILVNEIIKEKNSDLIIFTNSGKEISRKKLYSTFSKLIDKKFRYVYIGKGEWLSGGFELMEHDILIKENIVEELKSLVER